MGCGGMYGHVTLEKRAAIFLREGDGVGNVRAGVIIAEMTISNSGVAGWVVVFQERSVCTSD